MVYRGKSNTHFTVQALHDSSTLPRVLELFSIRDLNCDSLSASKSQDGMQKIELMYSDLEGHDAHVIRHKIQSIVTVQSVQCQKTLVAA